MRLIELLKLHFTAERVAQDFGFPICEGGGTEQSRVLGFHQRCAFCAQARIDVVRGSRACGAQRDGMGMLRAVARHITSRWLERRCRAACPWCAIGIGQRSTLTSSARGVLPCVH